ncbi:MAG TPA: lipid-binding SYLF domain-containing protein [Rhizomicrobium sp.]|jgi:lipid-binding SYLF domain-containing protein|nr:lipid-binding SYLF domain-containing protein [Rhizomicrobium sp.]
MKTITKVLALAALAMTVAAVSPADAKRKPAHVKPKPAVCTLDMAPDKSGRLVGDATRTLYDFRGSIPSSILAQAKGIIIVPNLVKVGFIIGGQGGDAVLLRRIGKTWTYPAFYSLGSPSLGLQAGVSSAQIVLVLMTDRAVDAVRQERFRLGTEAGLAIFMAGGNDGAASYHGDIIGWARAGGLYAGLTVNDSTLEQKPMLNAEYYDRPVPFDDIFMGRSCNRNADPLRAALR